MDQRTPKLLAAVLLLSVVPLASGANLVANGSFELPVCSASYCGGVTPDQWGLASGTVDLIGTYWQAAAGSQSLDLNGDSGGAILYQDLTGLVLGMTYSVRFAMSANPDQPGDKTMDVAVTGAGIAGPVWAANSYSFTSVAGSHSNMGWTYHTFLFEAQDTTARLAFASTTENCCWGPALDDVSVEAVPEPSTAWLLLGALPVLLFRRRK